MLGAGVTIDGGVLAAVIAVAGAAFVGFLGWLAKGLIRLGETQRESAQIQRDTTAKVIEHDNRIRSLEESRWQRRTQSR